MEGPVRFLPPGAKPAKPKPDPKPDPKPGPDPDPKPEQDWFTKFREQYAGLFQQETGLPLDTFLVYATYFFTVIGGWF